LYTFDVSVIIFTWMCRFIVNLCTQHAALYQAEYVSYGIIVLASKIGGTQTYTTPKSVKLLEGQGDRQTR